MTIQQINANSGSKWAASSVFNGDRVRPIVGYLVGYAVRSVTKLTIVKMAHFVPNFHKFLGDHRYYRPSFKLSSNVAPKVRLSSQTSDCRPNSSTTVDCCKQPSTFVYKYSTAICKRSTVVRKHSTVVREHSTLIHKHSMVVRKCSTVVHRLFTNARQLFRVVRECSTFK